MTHAEIGGPYASHDDALRAIQNGGFDQSAAELTVQEGSDDLGDKEASRRTAAGPPAPPPQVSAPTPGQPELPELGRPQPQQVPQSTKPSQVPEGGGLPQDPMSPGFDATLTGGPDPYASTIDSVADQVRQDNPHLSQAEARRIARKVTGRLAFFFTPSIEDPLADKSPLSVVNDVAKTLPKKTPAPSRTRPSVQEPEMETEPITSTQRGRQETPTPSAEHVHGRGLDLFGDEEF